MQASKSRPYPKHRGRGRAQIPRPGERIHGFRFYVQAAGAPEIANDTSKDKEEGKDKKGKDKKGKDKKGKDKKEQSSLGPISLANKLELCGMSFNANDLHASRTRKHLQGCSYASSYAS
ncbi:hypothetical protein G6O67_002112 [Ophiocordyceps sinensis]|uniref:Uncharacterized protein n=1 Tax=Ophiocordyceps sinensis TaxID=72228 RepID=A0A8H4PTK5_9HYPO|nr:hypothetical protein G6O67_002112 [Ophiocordyceps sinensis]